MSTDKAEDTTESTFETHEKACDDPVMDATDELLSKLSSLSLNSESKDAAHVEDTGARPPAAPTAKPLRPYQADILDKLIVEFTMSQKPEGDTVRTTLLYLPTGGGKTRIAAEILRHVVVSCGKKAMFLVNRNKLIEQAHASFVDAGLGECISFIKAGKPLEGGGSIWIASIQTLTRRMKTTAPDGAAVKEEETELPDKDIVQLPAISLLIIDEAHGTYSDSYLNLLATYRKRKEPLLVLGLTATPLRLDPSEKLSNVFHQFVKGPCINNLINLGFLVPPLIVDAQFRTLSPESAPAPATGGDDEASPQALALLVKEWQKRASDRLTVVFAVDIKSSQAIVQAFRRAGVPAAHIDGGTPETERQQTFTDFHEKTFMVLSSVGVLSEGFDEPQVSCVVLCRPTHSKALYIQQIGRGLRCFPGKTNCLVIDAIGATHVHGPVTGPIGFDWESENAAGEVAKVPKDRAKLGELPKHMKFVPQAWTCKVAGCHTINNIRQRICTSCGAIKPLGKRMDGQSSVANAKKRDPKQPTEAADELADLFLKMTSLAEPSTAAAISAQAAAVTQTKKQTLLVTVPRKHPTVLPASTATESKEEESRFAAPSLPTSVSTDPGGAHTNPAGDSRSAAAPSGSTARATEIIAAVAKSGGPGEARKLGPAVIVPAKSNTPTSITGGSVPGAEIFTLPAFHAGVTRFLLPKFDQSFANDKWERDFLHSIACRITDGVPHEYKGSDLRGKPLSEKQREILNRIVSRPRKR